MTTLSIREETLQLLPEKMVWWEQRQTLLVADTHFGKAASFRKAGIPVPAGTTSAMLTRLSNCINRHHPRRLLILGDFVHSKTSSDVDFEDELVAWRERHAELQLLLVRGNHDRGHRRLFQAMNMELVAEPFNEPPFSFCHYHQANSDATLYTLAGHVHPAVRLPQIGKVACFQFARQHALLPAFGDFTGTAIVAPEPDDRLFVVAEDQVLELESSLTVKCCPRG